MDMRETRSKRHRTKKKFGLNNRMPKHRLVSNRNDSINEMSHPLHICEDHIYASLLTIFGVSEHFLWSYNNFHPIFITLSPYLSLSIFFLLLKLVSSLPYIAFIHSIRPLCLLPKPAKKHEYCSRWFADRIREKERGYTHHTQYTLYHLQKESRTCYILYVMSARARVCVCMKSKLCNNIGWYFACDILFGMYCSLAMQ